MIFSQWFHLPPPFLYTKSNHPAICRAGIPAVNLQFLWLDWTLGWFETSSLITGFVAGSMESDWRLFPGHPQLKRSLPQIVFTCEPFSLQAASSQGKNWNNSFLLQILLDFTIFPTALFSSLHHGQDHPYSWGLLPWVILSVYSNIIWVFSVLLPLIFFFYYYFLVSTLLMLLSSKVS